MQQQICETNTLQLAPRTHTQTEQSCRVGETTMINLDTTYLGLKLRTPLVASASPLSHTISGIRGLEDAGASAVVLFSLFEEQIREDSVEINRHLSKKKRTSCFPTSAEFHLGPAGYLNHIRLAKEAVGIPIIASLNCSNVGTWTDYAKQVEQAGADAIECNICSMATDPAESSSAVEQKYLDILRAIKQEVKIPVAVKLSPFFTNMAYMARRLDECGADGLVLFNRFYQPDIDLHHLKLDPTIFFSTAHDLRLPLTWVGLLFGRVHASLAATGGIHTSEDVVKLLLAGANVTMLCSTLLENGVDQIRVIEAGLRRWLKANKFESVAQILGSLTELRSHEAGALERAQYIRAVKGVEHVRAPIERHSPVEQGRKHRTLRSEMEVNVNNIQTKGSFKTQRKRRTPAVGLSQVAASKISHPKHSEHPVDLPTKRKGSADFLQLRSR